MQRNTTYTQTTSAAANVHTPGCSSAAGNCSQPQSRFDGLGCAALSGTAPEGTPAAAAQGPASASGKAPLSLPPEGSRGRPTPSAPSLPQRLQPPHPPLPPQGESAGQAWSVLKPPAPRGAAERPKGEYTQPRLLSGNHRHAPRTAPSRTRSL